MHHPAIPRDADAERAGAHHVAAPHLRGLRAPGRAQQKQRRRPDQGGVAKPKPEASGQAVRLYLL